MVRSVFVALLAGSGDDLPRLAMVKPLDSRCSLIDSLKPTHGDDMDTPRKLVLEAKPLKAIADEQELMMVTGGSGQWQQKPAWGQVPIWKKAWK
jgi:hypothetical protein